MNLGSVRARVNSGIAGAAKIDDLAKMKELLERLADPNIVKTRVSFYTFTEYLGIK
jgi:hypothetical protein